MKPGSIRGGATGKRQKTMNAEHVDEHERVAQRPVDVRSPPPQPAEQPERDDEVGVVVVVGDQQPERVVPGQPAVERALGVDVQRALEAQNALRVRQRRVQAQRREVGDRVVDPAQPHDHERLDPPARARVNARRHCRRRRSPRRSRARRSVPTVDKPSMLSAVSAARGRSGPRDSCRLRAARARAPLGERLEHARQRRRGAPPGAGRGVVVGVVQQQHRARAGAVGDARGDRRRAWRAPPSRGPSGSTAACASRARGPDAARRR